MELGIRTPLLGSKEKTKVREEEKLNSEGRIIECCGCKQALRYPEGAYCVRCPMCKQVTAVIELSRMRCGRCSATMVFPVGSAVVTCLCGMAYGAAKA